MKVAKLSYLAPILFTVAITLAVGCSRAGVPLTDGVSPKGTPSVRPPLSRRTGTPPPVAEPQRYSTRELELASRSPQGMTLWEGKVIYSEAASVGTC